jgi:hypothetical protein
MVADQFLSPKTYARTVELTECAAFAHPQEILNLSVELLGPKPTATPESFFQFEEMYCGIFTQPMQLGDAFAICMSFKLRDGSAAEPRVAFESAETSRSASGTDSYASQGRWRTQSSHWISCLERTYLIERFQSGAQSILNETRKGDGLTQK